MKEDTQAEGLRYIPMSQIEMNVGQLEGLPENPRSIQRKKYEILLANITNYPEMLKYRSLMVYPLDNGNYIIIGGNMRYQALRELGYTEAPCIVIPKETSVDRLKAYSILDNNEFGEWDWDLLANEWDSDLLNDLGMDVWNPSEDLFNNEDETKDVANATTSEYVKFSKYKVMVTNEELKKLVEHYEKYMAENECSFGFFNSLLN